MTVRVVSRPCPVSDGKAPGNDGTNEQSKPLLTSPFRASPQASDSPRNGLMACVLRENPLLNLFGTAGPSEKRHVSTS